MRAAYVLVSIFVVSTVLGGCLAGPKGDIEAATSPVPFRFDYVNATWPDGAKARDFVASYIMEHPYRRAAGQFKPYMDKARDDLETLLKADNLTVVRHEYSATGTNILGIKNGTANATQWVVLSAHYDSASTTVYGAWDDGSGVAALLEIARATQDWKFPFTLVFAFFDEEERGLVGSTAFVKDYGEDQAIELVANLNTDPPGLNWPCGDQAGPFLVETLYVPNKKNPRYDWLHSALQLALDQTNVPKEVRNEEPGVTIAGPLRGGSDHQSFHDKKIANFFLGGVPYWMAAGQNVLTYPLHTPLDTLQALEARCTQGSFAGGLGTIATALAHTLVNLATGGPIPSAESK